jgi:hypothetical protein
MVKYSVRAFDPVTFKRVDRTYTDKQKAIARFNSLVKKGFPVIIHVLMREIPGFQIFDYLKDDNGKPYHSGAWKPYFDHKEK